MSYNTKNYTEQGGNKLVIGGDLEIKPDGTVTGLIADNLTTDVATKALSAKQGKKLNDEKVAIASIVNDLTTGGAAVPLSAGQGKVLGERVAANQADSTEASYPTVTEFNALLAKLKTAGLMVADV